MVITQPYLLCISILGTVILLGLHLYLQQIRNSKTKEGKKLKDDYFLLLMSIVFFFWCILAINELSTGEFGLIGRFFSVLTTSLILWSLYYFEDGIRPLSKYAIHLSASFGVVGVVTASMAERLPDLWYVSETLSSILAVLLLSASIAASFWNRKVKWMIFVPIAMMLVLGSTQIYLLSNETLTNKEATALRDFKFTPGSSIVALLDEDLRPSAEDRVASMTSDSLITLHQLADSLSGMLGIPVRSDSSVAYRFQWLRSIFEGWESEGSVARMLSRPLLLLNILLLIVTWVAKGNNAVEQHLYKIGLTNGEGEPSDSLINLKAEEIAANSVFPSLNSLAPCLPDVQEDAQTLTLSEPVVLQIEVQNTARSITFTKIVGNVFFVRLSILEKEINEKEIQLTFGECRTLYTLAFLKKNGRRIVTKAHFGNFTKEMTNLVKAFEDSKVAIERADLVQIKDVGIQDFLFSPNQIDFSTEMKDKFKEMVGKLPIVH